MVNHELTMEIDQLNKLLGVKRLERSFVDECISKINKAKTATEIKATEAMLALFTNMKLLPDGELNELYTQYNSRVGLLFNQYQPDAELIDNSLWWFYKLLRNNTKVHLLLDGHNILHLLSAIFSPFYEDDIPGGAAREQLIERMVKAVENYPNCLVNIFFDGPKPSEYSQATNVKVIYSGGGNSKHRADGVLLSYLHFIVGQEANDAAVIVTDDRDIQAKGEQLKAKIVSPIQFAGMING
jgi:predicted RNA-binding protein with PIN domain